MSSDGATDACDALDRTLADAGPAAMLDRLADDLAARGEYRALLDALLLRARLDLGLPLIHAGALAEIAEPTRSQYEDRYVAAIRAVGRRLLDAGEIGAAWGYFRAIGEKEPVAEAIARYQPPSGDDEKLNEVVDVAFNQGVAPARGFALILDHYGTCSAITAFEGLPPDLPVRAEAADRLVRRLHADLAANLRGEIARRGQPMPREGASIADLLVGRDWLFVDDAYHLDVSHLAATVRLAPLLTDPESIEFAIGLTDYGQKLAEPHRPEGDYPFPDHYADHTRYLNALLGRDADAALAHLRELVDRAEGADRFATAQAIVRLLVRLGRLDEAVEVAATELGGLNDAGPDCPGVAQLCQTLGLPDRLADLARARGELVHYAAAVIQARGGPGGIDG